MKLELGINIDHIATLRQARGGAGPSPLEAAQACVNLGAEYIVIHLRRDRRHIQENDLRLLTKHLRKHVHLEMAATQEMSDLAVKYKLGSVCIVPEYPGELTTSVGLTLAQGCGLRGGDVAGSDAVALDVVLAVLGGDVLGQHLQAALGCSVGGDGLTAQLAHHGADVCGRRHSGLHRQAAPVSAGGTPQV